MLFSNWSFRGLVVLIAVGLMAGCGTLPLKKAMYVDTAYNPESVGSILLLAPIDARIEHSINVDLSSDLNKPMIDMLERRGYAASVFSGSPANSLLLKDDLKSANAEFIKALGPDNARYVMILALDDVSTKLTFGSTGNAVVSGFMFDKQVGTTIWRDKGIGRAGQGGLIGMAMKGMMGGAAINSALNNLSTSLPVRNEDKK